TQFLLVGLPSVPRCSRSSRPPAAPLLRNGPPRPEGRSGALICAALRGARGGGLRARGAGLTGRIHMLRIYWVMLDAIEIMQPLIDQIRSHNRGLATQTDEASSSVPLNIAEGSGNRGGTRRERYNTALGSARET